MWHQLLSLLVVASASGEPHWWRSNPRYLVAPRFARAVVELKPGSDPSVSGQLTLVQVSNPEPAVVITGVIFGLKPGPHGFHIHNSGNLTNMCKDAGPHFNPAMKKHMGPMDTERHAGDLGNLVAPPYGPTSVYIIDKIVTLGDKGTFDVAGRAIVVHEKEDDLGRGGDEESLKTGNAGNRLACGVIDCLNCF